MRRTALALALLILAGATLVADTGSTTVILVRHAEKECSGGDVPLKPEGAVRARALIPVVERAGVDVAIHSDARRTRLTLDPAIAALGLPPERVLERTQPADVAEEILTRQRGRTVLVAGHSNTVPAIIEALGAASPCPRLVEGATSGCLIPDPQFHHLFVLTLSPEEPATMVWASYGGPSLPGAGCH